MVTKSNINKAKESYLMAQAEYEQAQVFLDALKSYVKEFESGVYEQDELPQQGPFTKDQAEIIDVVIPSDYSMPAIFGNYEVYERASDALLTLEGNISRLKEEMEEKHETLKNMEQQRSEDLERAKQLAENDPRVIEAKEKSQETQAALEAERIKQESKRETRNLIVFGLVGFAIVVIATVAIVRFIK